MPDGPLAQPVQPLHSVSRMNTVQKTLSRTTDESITFSEYYSVKNANKRVVDKSYLKKWNTKYPMPH